MKPAGSLRTFTFGSRTVTFETGRIARQAHGSVLVRSGDTTVLVTAVAADSPREAADFFPLTVEYREKASAVGRVPGSYLRREGRISDHEVLESRLVDRSIRPLFPDGYRNEVQVQATVLSADPDADPGVLAILGAGAALHLSPIPFAGPAGGLRIARVDGRWSLLPGRAERDEAELDFVVSVGPSGLVMVEGGAAEQGEDVCADALFQVEEALAGFLRGMDEWRSEAGAPKDRFAGPALDPEVVSAIESRFSSRLAAAMLIQGKKERRALVRALKDEAVATFVEKPEARAEEIFGELEYRVLRRMIVERKKRLDGRSPDQIRPIWGETGWLQRPHGSALFTRGETQAMVTCTLGASDDEQRVDRLFGEQKVRFLLHYNFPPYSVGEIRPLRGPGRREIGHGELARRAIIPVLPEAEAFPYVIRIDSEISESNGSSSMATTCGAVLAMMDAGVPIPRPVAGIAMGLVTEGGETVILSDILGDEDHLGDMDFKVTGTERGITAVQMDNKSGGLQRSVLGAALQQARAGREHILREMAKVLAAPREELSRHAPRMLAMRVRQNMIGAVIGPKGATIKSIQEDTGARISIADDGLVTIFASEGESAKKALARIRGVAGEVEVGKYYKGVVTGVKEFGAFVKIFEQAEGLVHISELANERIARVEDVVREGEEVVVKVLGVDDRGRIKLSRKAALGVDPALVQR